uniref:Uncharacterized protein n=1 Tax=Romanomermis culicivorax TaxID=13658 RepID=A0A915KZX6_ROMCU
MLSVKFQHWPKTGQVEKNWPTKPAKI